ncbi:hypothetical protein GLAREA_10168 [Glarea lozoyensis ATCC 20868]|uniref:AMP-activated protein kinase glycogen-binding domain-containing protein n=2 Tax=Glarea lozoyensis TaxID=101852 RepID=S3DBI0_GLAL2|nr:uncharacterized protein GLAREA_10168 [Glarea lozoyensis ATCC 20868]EHL00084.1 putative Signal transduction protein MDG1 [Glarea lozoyensis 74030]EPE34474.1 hypothetical protein GLAREA_10168 [Glarea lozoyensis ATCC 20868]
MGSFVFKWDHPASEVYVTGTFDNWSKSEKLVKTGDVFEKDVTLSSAGEKIYYKFVVDGNWVTDHTAPQENDESGNLNNVLTTDRIIKHKPETAGIMSGVAPNSTTAALAKDVPFEHEKDTLEQTGSSDLPGSFPETPAAVEKGDFSVNPLPAAEGAVNPIRLAPGEKVPESGAFTENTITSGVHDDPELVAADKAKSEGEQSFGVSPLPAFAGAVNPVHVAPGEKLPKSDELTTNILTSGVHDDPELVAADKAKGESDQTFSVSPLPAFPGAVNPINVAPGEKLPEVGTLTGNTISSAVHTDKESYEGSSALPPVLPPVVTPQAERDSTGTGVLDLPPVSKSLIPESSLPIGATGVGSFDATPTIQSAGPQSTTSQLAGSVPLESNKVPEIVKESQEEAGFAPEASSVPEEVKEKSEVEKELLSEVPVAPSTSEGTAGEGTTKSEKTGASATEAATAVKGAAFAVGAAVVGGAAFATTKLPTSVSNKLPESVQNSINTMNAESTPNTDSANNIAAKDTPAVVKESITEAGRDPEAAANEEAVLEKKAMEKELLSEVKPETSSGEPAPKITDASVQATTAENVPEIVQESIARSGQDPEAAANEEVVLEKKAIERELLSEVKPETSSGEPAPKINELAKDGDVSKQTSSPAVAETATDTLAAPATPAKPESRDISRDVSPGTIPGSHSQTQPTVTTGIATATTESTTVAAPAIPAKAKPAAAAPASTSSTPGSSKVAESPAAPSTTDKKNKRRSLFGRIKDKLKN